MKGYIGHPLQVRGAEQYVLQGGKGNGMHFLCVRNGLGLEVWISIDRAGDLSRVNFKGDNIGYFSPCGYVSPQYYDGVGAGFLKSFTAGFLTTCGLTAVGSPCTDEGEDLPLHGKISNIPAELLSTVEKDDCLEIVLRIRECDIFGRKLVLDRKYCVSYIKNEITLSDTVTNDGDATSPYMILYHCNIGYPLLTEKSEVRVPNNGVKPRNDHAGKYIDTALCLEKPQAGYEERCYYFDVFEKDGVARAGIYNADIGKGVVLAYDKKSLPCFTEWKMMGKAEYVLGLEPGNATPDGRDVLRRENRLEFLAPEESKTTSLKFTFCDDIKKYEGEF